MSKTSGATPNPAQKIILKFGGQTGLAKFLDRPQSTVQDWSRTGTIPAKWQQKLLDLATMHGVSIGPTDFVAVTEANAIAARRPEAKWPGFLDVAGVEIPCYVLNDGRRVISRTGALNYLAGGKGGGNLESYLRVENLRTFLPTDLSDQFIDVTLPQVVNKDVKGLTAHAFIDICRAYSRARDTGALTESQLAIAVRASVALAAFAKVGIEAAIDEATGYQYIRAEDAIRMKLKLFIADEMRPWEKTFPDELWVQFGRLTRWRGAIHERAEGTGESSLTS